MKKFSVFLCTVLLVLAAFFFSSAVFSVGHAYVITYDQILWQEDAGLDPTTLSATIELFEIDSSDDSFRIILTNTSSLSTPSDYPAPVLLTGIGFNLGVEIIGGSVLSDNLSPDGTSPSEHWGYDNDPTSGYFQNPPGGVTTKNVDAVVSTMTAAVENIFFPGLGPIGKYINGPDYGVASNDYLTSIYGAPPYPYFAGFMEVEVWLGESVSVTDWDEFFADIDSQSVVIAFGSPTAVVPEPATMLLLGAGLIGLAAVGRKRFFKKA